MNSAQISPTFRMMSGQVERLETISENLANCMTPGFKKLQLSHKRFETVMDQSVGKGTWLDGKAFDPVDVDFTAGPLRPTERPLDFAINGTGFFAVAKDDKEYYTRKGDFMVDPNGTLLTRDGFEVQSEGGPISIPQDRNLSQLTVSDDGTLRIGDQTFGKFKIVSFENPHALSRVATTLYEPADGQEPVEGIGENQIINGTLETSNTTIFAEMADMIACMRGYEACQRMVRAEDEKDGKMIQQLGG